MPMQCFVHVKVNCDKKYPILPTEKFPFLALAMNTMIVQHLIIHFRFIIWLSGRLEEVKNTGKFQTFCPKLSTILRSHVSNQR